MSVLASETLDQALTGRCLCGTVRYRCDPPIIPPTLCHCASCRRASGAHALGWITVDAERFAVLEGHPRIYASSPGVERTFCGQCGSPLTYSHGQRPGELDVTLGSLDPSDRVVPVDHIWMSDALSWDKPADGLPQHPTVRRD